MKNFKAVAYTLGFVLLAAANGQAATVTTPPVGALSLDFPSNSDTNFSLPFSRPAEYVGTVESITNNTLTVATSNWTADEWLYDEGPFPSNTYYILITSGTMEGMYYTVTANSTNSLTVDPANEIDDLAAQGVQASDTFEIIPYWTLNTVFPEGAGIHVTSDIGLPQSTVIETDNSVIGIGNSLRFSFLYHDGSQGPAGWYTEGNIGAGIQNDRILLPDNFYVVRNPDSGPQTGIISGHVPMTSKASVISTLAENEVQDNYLAVPFPIDLSLAESGLSNSPAFTVTTDVGLVQDTVVLYDEEFAIINKPLKTSYFYHDGSQGPAGWYIEGNIGAGLQDNEKILLAGRGFVIRKQAGAINSQVWISSPPY